MVTNIKASKIYKFFVLQVTFFLLKFVGMLFAGNVFVGAILVPSVTSSRIITESSIILLAYLPFSQVHVEGLQI